MSDETLRQGELRASALSAARNGANKELRYLLEDLATQVQPCFWYENNEWRRGDPERYEELRWLLDDFDCEIERRDPIWRGNFVGEWVIYRYNIDDFIVEHQSWHPGPGYAWSEIAVVVRKKSKETLKRGERNEEE